MNPFIEARNAGLSPIPVRKGSKVPAVSWKDFQVEICSELQATEWGNGGGYSIGLVTGEVSGRLMAVDIEAGFVDRLPELRARLAAAGLEATFNSWIAGYCESTPRGGLHILVRLEGDGGCPRNEVFASDVDGKVLVETRGEGGYVLVAPTVGYVVGSGGFSSIVYCTLEEWLGVQAVLASFDDSPPAPARTVATRSTVALPSILRFDEESWIEPIKAGLPPIRTLLEDHGWVFPGASDQFGTHCVRPGKNPREGHSANLSHDGYLYVHSSNADLPIGVGLDNVALLICWQTGQRTAPDKDERTSWFQAQRPTPAERTGVGAAPHEGEVATPNLSPDLCIEDWFWEARPLFGQLRDAATERGVSPDGVFGAWLSEYAATIPMGIWVAGPPTRAPLNMFVVLVGSSGTGKTGSMRIASDLVGWNRNQNLNVLLGRGLRSGEGLCKLAQIPARKDDDGPPAYRNAIQVAFDEGGVLGKQADRSGATIIPYLNTAWSGAGTVGGALAREVFEFPADLVRICAVLGVQYGAAANLFEGESARLGFPQRLLYFGLRKPALLSSDVDRQTETDPKPLDLPFYDHANHAHPTNLTFPDQIEHNIRLWTQNKDHGTGIDDPLDAHQMNLTKRVAGVLCLADRRSSPSEQDWDLASHVVHISRNIRRTLIASLKDIQMEPQRARINEAVQTADALDDSWIRRRAIRITRHIHHQQNGCTLKDIRTRLAGNEKKRVHEMLAYAADADWVIHREERWFPGGSQPAF